MTPAFGLAPQKNWGEKWIHHNYGAFFVGIKILPNEINTNLDLPVCVPNVSLRLVNSQSLRGFNGHHDWFRCWKQTPSLVEKA